MKMPMTRLYEDTDWSPDWRPTPGILQWFRNLLRGAPEGTEWTMPSSGQVYKISHADKTVTLIKGAPNDSMHWHDKNKLVFGMLGYRTLDPSTPDQAFAESSRLTARQIVSVLVEEAEPGTPFSRKTVQLQYRPFLLNGEWKWFWTLLPEDGSAALDTGHADNRAAASVSARRAARKLGVNIAAVDVMQPN